MAFLRSRLLFLLTFFGLLALNSGLVASRAWGLGVDIWPALATLFVVEFLGVLGILFGHLRPVEHELRALRRATAEAQRLELEAAEQLRAARDVALEANRAKSQFLANMSHEMRTPLTGILGMIDLLTHTKLDPTQKRYVDTLVTTSEALLSLVEDVLDISKIEAGKMHLDRAPFDLRQTALDACRVLSAQASQKGLALETDLDAGLATRYVGDAHRLRQILLNLLGNAIKFTSSGEVRLRVRNRGVGLLEFAISDTGIGIPPDRLQAIFEPFEQADANTARAHGGTGLGLSISALLVSRMGGTLSVASEVAKGSTFTFALPLEPVAELVEVDLSAPSPEPGPASRNSVERILLAEDNLVNQQVVLLRLQQAGFEVSIAANGREAVEAFDRGGIDLILMDVQMPEMDGLRATRLIRSREKATGGHIPIVAVTANVLEGERRRCLTAGMDDYLSKPVRSKELFETVARLLHRPDLASPPPAEGDPDRSVATTPSAEKPDWLLAMQSMNFGEEAIHRLLHAFALTVPERLASLQEAVDLADSARVILLSHTLKGSLVVFGAKHSAELAGRLEQGGREGKLEEAAALLAKIRESVAPLLDSMRAYLGDKVTR
jgi:signal transduction histidine kinase/DNA-binding response OmpR family regulator